MNVNLGNVTNTLRGVWEELVERRLWPVAVALLVAIVAVPVVLAKPAKQPPAPPAAPAATGGNSPGVAFQPAVSTQGKKSSEIRKNLRRFSRKNPFTPQGLGVGGSGTGTASPVAASPLDAVTAGSTGGQSFAGGSSSSGSSGTSTGSSGSATPTSGTTTQTKTFYYTYTVDVKFGKTGQEDDKTLTEFRALPSSENPVIVFMGVRNDGETAVFLVSANATTTGDGKCAPSDTECTFLYMKKDDSQTIESVDSAGAVTDYTLELRDINVKRTTAPQKASSSTVRTKSRLHLRRIVNNLHTLGL
jgi:hypothetical protein